MTLSGCLMVHAGSVCTHCITPDMLPTAAVTQIWVAIWQYGSLYRFLGLAYKALPAQILKTET